MSIREKFKRTGAFVIDLSIATMFTRVLVNGVIVLLSIIFENSGFSQSLTLNDAAALPVILALYVFILMLFIGIYVGYHRVCYRFIHNSLGRYFLGIHVVSTDNDHAVSLHTYLTREFYKISLTVCTIGVYSAYCAAQYYAFSHLPYHDKKMGTTLILV